MKTTVTTPYTFDCDYAGCDFKTSTHESLTHHIKRDHTKAYKCSTDSDANPKKGRQISTKAGLIFQHNFFVIWGF